jgi:molybdate transport system substrate-binding protein
VLAAASLTEAFTAIGTDFERAHPGSTVILSFGSSTTLATQINQGAPADVFAAADEATMTKITAAGNGVADPVIFATNTLQIAVPRGNPGKITGLADFGDPDRRTALCAPQVPCGAAATRLFAVAGITPQPASYERDVKAALQKVRQNEVDAALVYRTDVRAAGGQVQGIEVPQAGEVVNRYPIITLTAAADPKLAGDFVDHIRSPRGERFLRNAGFGSP